MNRARWLLGCVVLGALVTASRADAPALRGERSSFLRAHAAGEVNWMAWGEAAFARARTEQKPLFVAIGAFTSELADAMMRESFGNATTAAWLNKTFVCVLVDAKESPELAARYQRFVQVTRQVSGLPLNLWLTPELRPFEGTNYLPPTDEWGKEGFLTTARRAADAWTSDPAGVRRRADDAIAATTAVLREGVGTPVEPDKLKAVLTSAAEAWVARAADETGGFGEPPFGAEPELRRFLLTQPAARELALQGFKTLIASGLRDPLDGGFFRTVQDAAWRAPQFQKQLDDQARVASALVDAGSQHDDPVLAEAARAVLAYTRAQRRGDGDFVSAESASMQAGAGFYLWTQAEVEAVLGAEDGAEFNLAYGITKAGSLPEDGYPGVEVKGKNLPRRVSAPGSPAAEAKLRSSASRLEEARRRRAAPPRDEGATAATHGRLLAAGVRAGARWPETAVTEAARRQVAFLRERLRGEDGRLLHLADRPGAAVPSDYAGVVLGLQRYHELTGDQEAARLASVWMKELHARFWDAGSGRFFATSAEGGPGDWGRVSTPAAPRGETFAEADILVMLAARPAEDVLAAEMGERLAGALFAEVEIAGEGAGGDLLFALQCWRERLEKLAAR